MSIHVHKTGLNKTLGQQSDTLSAISDLTGNWDPSIGIETLYWDNQVANGKNLRRYNGILHHNSAPHHFQFDGVDDYLGEASTGYGGDPFTLNIGSPYTVGEWVKYDNVNHVVFSVDVDGNNQVRLLIETSSDQAKLYVNPNNPTEGSHEFSNFTFSDDVWYYVSLVHDGSGNYTLFVNGSFKGASGTAMDPLGTGNFRVGYDGVNYSGATTKVGHLHVYTAALTNSQLRQNFLASHVINNTRIYGATYTA